MFSYDSYSVQWMLISEPIECPSHGSENLYIPNMEFTNPLLSHLTVHNYICFNILRKLQCVTTLLQGRNKVQIVANPWCLQGFNNPVPKWLL